MEVRQRPRHQIAEEGRRKHPRTDSMVPGANTAADWAASLFQAGSVGFGVPDTIHI
jgi:hypothetical protein